MLIYVGVKISSSAHTEVLSKIRGLKSRDFLLMGVFSDKCGVGETQGAWISSLSAADI